MRTRPDQRRDRPWWSAGPARAARPPRPPGERTPFRAELVDGVVDAALEAVARRDPAGVDDAVALLTRGPDLAAGAPADGGPALVDRALGRRLLVAVGEAWARGWQPADLARLAGRELGRGPGRLAARAIVRETALYPPATVPARWRAQVDDLGDIDRLGGHDRVGAGNGRDGRDDRGDERWAVALGPDGDRRAAVLVAVDVLALLHRLPPVPTLAPRPGDAVGAGDRDGQVDPRMLQRVRGLLAKAESTTFPDEAEALTAKAQELMARHAIDAAVLAAESGRPVAGATARRLGVDDPYAAAKAMLLEAISSANRCRSVWTKGYGYATVFGDEGDLEAVELLYTSLLVQAARAMLTEAGGAGRPNAGRTRSYRQSFLVAFALRIGDRLREAVEEATAAHGVRRETLLPVLADRLRAAEAACDAVFPQVRATRLSANDHAGWHAGVQAAEVAQLDMHTPLASRPEG
jgi:hypothetical protein